MTAAQAQRSTFDKLAVFRECFTGLEHVYGTRDLSTNRIRQVKRPVTDQIILSHLQGKHHYGMYLLVENRTRAVVVDFDTHDLMPAVDFREAAHGYGIPVSVERSKSKGHHVWVFLDQSGVLAAKARLVVRHILSEIGLPNIEVFPKQDALDTRVTFGNFIFAPLCGALVPKGRTVFLRPDDLTRPFPHQWELLSRVERVGEKQLDEIIEINELDQPDNGVEGPLPRAPGKVHSAFGLPPCAQRMLTEGVTEFQRVACFRLAVQLKKSGLPEDIAVASLKVWAAKNRPQGEKRVITEDEILAQVTGAYSKNYRSCGCGDPAVAPYCEPDCPLFPRNNDRCRPRRTVRPTEQRSCEASSSAPTHADTEPEEHADAQR